MPRTRRSVLRATGAALAGGALAGCLDGVADGRSGDSPVQASFFVLYDFAREIAGDHLAIESVVPFGQHGHGWEPTGQVQRDIYDAPLFAYVGEGFQPWADDVVTNLRGDDADVVIVEGWAGVDLLDYDHGDENGHDDDGDHAHDGAGHDGADGHEHNGHEHEHDRNGEDEQDDQDHGQRDPHYWLDPLRAKQTVANLADGLQTADPEHGSAYRERAQELTDELEELHGIFDSRLEGATTDAVLIAGHNSFQYLGRRYGFEVYSLSGLSPDEEPSASARRAAAEVVAEHGIEYVLAPALESTRAAEQLVAETDAADYLEIADLSGVKGEWPERDWGYLDVMGEVNLPALERALGVP